MSDLPGVGPLKTPDPPADVKARAAANFRRIAQEKHWTAQEIREGLAALGLDNAVEVAR